MLSEMAWVFQKTKKSFIKKSAEQFNTLKFHSLLTDFLASDWSILYCCRAITSLQNVRR